MNWNELEDQCVRATVESIKKLLSENPTEVFYAFALYTDSSAMTVSLSANSEQSLKAILDSEDDKSKENQTYYKWAASEWAYEGFNAAAFTDISKLLRESTARSNFITFKQNLIECLTQTLKRVKNEELNEYLKSSVLFVTITDDDDSEAVENASAKQINDEPIISYFVSRYN